MGITMPKPNTSVKTVAKMMNFCLFTMEYILFSVVMKAELRKNYKL